MTVRLLDFYADWCGPCKTQEPIVEDLESEYADLAVERIDVDEAQDRANEYQVRSLPTLIVETDEEIVDRFIGVTQAEDLASAIEDAIENATA
ncbi:thioredoxin family protein [Halococcoides cellulosivorans]|uniref:Thiol reductase thioredoxin n=1 Tax=Halococcoides cellulosivorans TaxID=1679096 RepID=A0A2R4WZ24_9EURY|nr:thioredoxin domain-containing protein [Halococcoides cellulosivorans]AWB26793.1 thiol reductase thioredoxin [Halococcoides cellulosivorans]